MTQHVVNSVRLWISKYWLYAYTGYSWATLVRGLGAAASAGPTFLLNSPARIATWNRMVSLAKWKVWGNFIAGDVGQRLVMSWATSRKYITVSSSGLTLHMRFTWVRRGRRV